MTVKQHFKGSKSGSHLNRSRHVTQNHPEGIIGSHTGSFQKLLFCRKTNKQKTHHSVCLCVWVHLCWFGEQLAGEVVQIFVHFFQSLNFFFELSDSNLRVLAITKHRLKTQTKTSNYTSQKKKNKQSLSSVSKHRPLLNELTKITFFPSL